MDAAQKSLMPADATDATDATDAAIGSLLLLFQCCVELDKTQEAKAILERLLTSEHFTEIEVEHIS